MILNNTIHTEQNQYILIKISPFYLLNKQQMMKITNGKVIYNGVDITNRPIRDYIWMSRQWSFALKPTYAERRINWNRIDTINDWDRLLYEVRHNYELDNIFGSRRKAEAYLQTLIDADDYYNWNEKDYWEFEF